MITLPSVSSLIQRTKALAALDLVMSPEWESRYYSFNSAWSESEQMASMRDGCGCEWWLVVHSSGWAALKGFAPDSPAWRKGRELLSRSIQSAFPSELAEFAHEPAFVWESTTFGYYVLPASHEWISAGASTPFADLNGGDAELLSLLTGTAQDYVDWAADYYERELATADVQRVFDLQPLTDGLLSRLNPDVSLSDIDAELFTEIAYPRPGI